MTTNNSGSFTEFLTEANFVLTQEDYGNKLEDLLAPIKNLLIKEKDLLSFSLARYCGANTRIAFFCEWYHQFLKIATDKSKLFSENQEYFRKKVPLKLRGVPNLHDLVDKHIIQIFQPHQISILNNKTKELVDDLNSKYSYLGRYLARNYLNQFIASQFVSVKSLYSEKVLASEYLESMGRNIGFVQIGLPVLLGLAYNFNQPNNNINPTGVKWVLLEELLRSVASLYQTASSKDLQRFFYAENLNEKEQFEWWQLDESQQLKRALSSSEAREKAKKYRQKMYDTAINNLEFLVFPDEYKEMLKDLIEWSYAMG